MKKLITNNRVAILDLGTNTLKLLIAEQNDGQWEFILDTAISCRLGEGLKQSKRLSPNAKQRALDALDKAIALCDRSKVSQIYPIATEAFRIADNGEDFRLKIKKELNLDFKIISGDEEAALALEMLKYEFPLSMKETLIIDIGGGSTEISAKYEVRSTNGKTKEESSKYEVRSTNGIISPLEKGGRGVNHISSDFELQNIESPSTNFELRTSDFELRVSLPMGCVTLTEEFLPSDPPTEDEVLALQDHIKSIISQFPKPENPLSCIGLAGTLVTLGSLFLGEFNAENIHGLTMTYDQIDIISLNLNHMTNEERKTMPGMILNREDVLPAGAIMLLEIMTHFHIDTVTISTHGIRHGYLYSLERCL